MQDNINNDPKPSVGQILLTFIKFINILFLMVGVISIIQTGVKYFKIKDYKEHGLTTNAVIVNKNEHLIKEQNARMISFEKFSHLTVDFDIDGKKGTTLLQKQTVDYNKYNVGDSIKIVYLEKNLYENSALKDQNSEKPYQFLMDNEPVSEDFLNKNVFLSAQFIIGVILILLFFFIRKL